MIRKSRFILHFIHEHVEFRWPEFCALTSKHNCNFELVSPIEHVRTRPYILIDLNDSCDGFPDNIARLIASARDSFLLKALYEFWACSKRSIEDLSNEVTKSRLCREGQYATAEQCFRVDCESFNTKLPQSTKVDYIQRLSFLDTFQCKPNLSEPRQIYCLLEMNEKDRMHNILSTEYLFGRLIAHGNRDAVKKFTLKQRAFIANTTMDPLLSLITTNMARVKPNDIVYDPFVGSGSFLLTAAYMGAYVIGSDIDWPLLHGVSKPTRIGHKVRNKGEGVRANLRQHQLEARYIDVLVADISKAPLSDALTIDSIICDPPYGIRECSEKIGARRKDQTVKNHTIRYPGKTNYCLGDLYKDLLELAARHLISGGRLVFFLPVLSRASPHFEAFTPSHPCLRLVSSSEQSLSGHLSRLLVVMEKVRDPDEGDRASVPNLMSETNFRDYYFNRTGGGQSDSVDKAHSRSDFRPDGSD